MSSSAPSCHSGENLSILALSTSAYLRRTEGARGEIDDGQTPGLTPPCVC